MTVETGQLRVVGPDGSERAATESTTQGEISPGQFIMRQRQRRGMSIEQMAAATKIPRRSLELLEAGRYSELPGPVFVKGFFRCSARALGLDSEAVLELLYEEERAALKARRREGPVTGSLPKVPERLWGRLAERLPSTTTLLWILVILVIAVLVLAAFHLAGGTGQGTPST
jgi:cytoskeletal protein RodZ